MLSFEAVGYSDEGEDAAQKDAIVWIASMSKPITAVGLMILVDEGKVNLDDPVEKYLPEFKSIWLATEKDKDHILLKKPTKVMTVRHLLDHTSGMPFKSEMEAPTLDRMTLQDSVLSHTLTPLQTERHYATRTPASTRQAALSKS